jgi:group I intron endonuclease
MICGIYSIQNIVTGKHYVGCSTNCRRRWTYHKYQLKSGTHHSIKLQRSYDKHGLEAFVFTIIQEIDNPEDLHDVEADFIELYQSWSNGYNVLKPVANFGESKARSVQNLKVGKHTEEKKPKDKKHRYQINFYASDEEAAKLMAHCDRTMRNKTEVLRELIRLYL